MSSNGGRALPAARCKPKVVKVLVVDDDRDDYFTVSRMLRDTPDRIFRLEHIPCGESAIDEISARKHDVVLLDYFISDMTALELLDRMDRQLDLPVIVLTGKEPNGLVDEVLEAGAFEFLSKAEISPALLSNSIDFAIRHFAIEQRILARQERIRRQCENAENALISKSEFLSFLGQEVKTPLNSIIGFSKMLREPNNQVPESYRQYASSIHESANHLRDIVLDLLDLSEAQADSFDVRNRRFKRYRSWIIDRQESEENRKPTGKL